MDCTYGFVVAACHTIWNIHHASFECCAYVGTYNSRSDGVVIVLTQPRWLGTKNPLTHGGRKKESNRSFPQRARAKKSSSGSWFVVRIGVAPNRGIHHGECLLGSSHDAVMLSFPYTCHVCVWWYVRCPAALVGIVP